MSGGISEMLALDSNKAVKQSEQAIGRKPISNTPQHLFQLLCLDSCPIRYLDFPHDEL